MPDPINVDALAAEVSTGNFRDARLTARLGKLVRGVCRDPQASFPELFKASELEAAYRFFSNVFVTPTQILEPHVAATKERVAAEATVRVVHDTTEFAYRRDGKRRGFDEERAYQSFCGHFSLAVSADSSRKPLGIAAAYTWPKGNLENAGESLWLQQARTSEQALDCGAKAIHICDRGADDYVFLSELVAGGHRFVLRSSVDRQTLSGDDASIEKMRSVLARVEHVEERSTWINRRRRHSSKHRAKIHPERDPRTIHLHISAAKVELVRPQASPKRRAQMSAMPELLAVNVVRVWEPDPPEGETAVEWFLFTSEPIETAADVEAVVDHYRARWVIEEYFKALKTGCAFEQRQLQDYESLVNALALFIPVAYQLLLLRTIARATPEAPASVVVTEDQIAVLRALGRRTLPLQPTARDVLLAIAALGGHIKYAPDPGWLTISRGYEKLETLTLGWLAAKIQLHSDQR